MWGANSSDEIWYRNGVDGSWQKVDGKLKQVHVTASTQAADPDDE